jgi:membrane-bound lytic murein transglycosylase D
VPKLIACALVAKHPRAFGFSEDEFDFQQPLEFDEVPVVEPTDLDVLARAAGTTTERIHELNPELRRWCTPPSSAARPYVVKVPMGTKDTVVAALARIPASERLTYRIHHVRKGDTLSRIALQYHSAPEAILQFNRLRSAKTLRINSELAIPVPSARALADGGHGLERQVARARAQGYVAPAPEDEVPAGTRTGRARALAQGTVKSEVVDGKTRVQYGVQSGDSMWTIAQRFNVSVEQIQTWNNLGKKARKGLQVGTVLTVWPGPAAGPIEATPAAVLAKADAPATPVQPVKSTVAAPAPGAKPGIHQLAEGETLWSVAQQYGVSVDDLKRWNRIRHARSLRPGLNLRVGGPPD